MTTTPEVTESSPAREHATDGGSCWCGPTVEFIGDGHVVIHNQGAA